MHIHASPAQLGAQIAKRKQLIGAKQDVYGLSSIGDRFDDIKLIG